MFRKNRRTNSIALLLAVLGIAAPVHARYAKAPIPTGGGGDPGAGGGGGGDPPADPPADPAAGGDPPANPAEGGAPDPVATVPKAQFDALHRETMARKDRVKALEKQLADLQGRMPSETELTELREARVRAQQAEEEQKKKAGQFDEILRDAKTKAKEEADRLRAELAQERAGRHEEKIVGVLATHIPKYTGADAADVINLLRKDFAVNEAGAVTVVVNGETPTNPETGREYTPEEYIAAQIAKRPYLVKVEPTGGSGGGNQRGRGAGGKKVWTPEEVKNLNHADYQKHEAEILAQAQANTGAGT